MASAKPPLDEELHGQFEMYRADLRQQFGRNCFGYAAAFIALLILSSIAIWALVGIAFWTLMLYQEARLAFGTSQELSSEGFLRWKRRQDWVEAANGDLRSLKRLQNVQ